MQFRIRWLPIGFEYLRLFASGSRIAIERSEIETEIEKERERKREREREQKTERKKHDLVKLNFAVPTTQLWLARTI